MKCQFKENRDKPCPRCKCRTKVYKNSLGVYLASKSYLHTWIITANGITCEHRGHLGTQYNSVPEINQDNDIFNQTRLEFM